MTNRKEITSADELIPGKTYFLEQNDFVCVATFQETKPPENTYKGANVFVPDSQPLACFFNLTRIFNDRYELFKACQENNVHIYEEKEPEDETNLGVKKKDGY